MCVAIRDTLESDTKTLNQYKESFDCIKEVAELNEVDAIVAKFLSQEAENFALFNYVTELNGEIEMLQEEVNVNKQEIEKLDEEHHQALEKNEFQLVELQVQHRSYNSHNLFLPSCAGLEGKHSAAYG